MTLRTDLMDRIDHRLHDQLVELVFDHGPQRLEWLVRRARRELHDAQIDKQAVIDAIEPSTLLVPPSGEIDHDLCPGELRADW